MHSGLRGWPLGNALTSIQHFEPRACLTRRRKKGNEEAELLPFFFLEAFINELDAKDLGAVASVRQSGCMGKCDSEPTVEVIAKGMPTVIYGKVTPALAKEIVQSHFVDNKILDNLVIEKK